MGGGSIIVEERRGDELRERTKKFSLRIIRLYCALPQSTEAQVIGKQVCVREHLWEHIIGKPAARDRMPSLPASSKVRCKNWMRHSIGWNSLWHRTLYLRLASTHCCAKPPNSRPFLSVRSRQ